MTAVMVEIRPRPGGANTPQEAENGPLEFVPDLDVYLRARNVLVQRQRR